MQRARLIIQPIRVHFSITKSPYSHLSHHPSLPSAVLRNHKPLKTWMRASNHKMQISFPNYCWNIISRKFHHHVQKLSSSESRFTVSGILGSSVLAGSISLSPHIGYSMDGFEFEVNDDQLISMDGSQSEEYAYALSNLVKKLLVPVFLILTVLTNWGHPIVIAAKVTLILFTTKPSSLSIYLFVEQLRRQAMRQHPFISKFKPFHAKKVEVEDYVFLCLASVELNDQRYTLVGMLGSWWVLPQSSWREAFFTPSNRSLYG